MSPSSRLRTRAPRGGDELSGPTRGTVGAADDGNAGITTEPSLVTRTLPQAVSRQRARGCARRSDERLASSVGGSSRLSLGLSRWRRLGYCQATRGVVSRGGVVVWLGFEQRGRACTTTARHETETSAGAPRCRSRRDREISRFHYCGDRDSGSQIRRRRATGRGRGAQL